MSLSEFAERPVTHCRHQTTTLHKKNGQFSHHTVFEPIEKAVRRITVTRRTESGATALAELTTINTWIRHRHANACPKNKRTCTLGICREIFIEDPGDYQ